MMQDVLAKHLDLPETRVRVICKDVGGSFGIKVHVYPDEMATCAAVQAAAAPGQIRRRPAGELLSRHPRPRPPRSRPAWPSRPTADIRALEIDDLTGIGPYSVYPAHQRRSRPTRSSTSPAARMRAGLQGPGPRRAPEQERRPASTARWATRSPSRSPRASSISAAARLGMDPAEIRRRNLIPDDAYPCVVAGRAAGSRSCRTQARARTSCSA